jgi:hypothetical protein
MPGITKELPPSPLASEWSTPSFRLTAIGAHSDSGMGPAPIAV